MRGGPKRTVTAMTSFLRHEELLTCVPACSPGSGAEHEVNSAVALGSSGVHMGGASCGLQEAEGDTHATAGGAYLRY